MRGLHRAIGFGAALCALAGCGARDEKASSPAAGGERPAAAATETAASAPAKNPLRNAYFGDLHVHTGLSFDAFIFGVRASPEDAYRYARGEEIKHPAGYPMKLDRPLDFEAVTDHAMYLGMVPAMADPNSSVGQHPLAQKLQQAKTSDERITAFTALITKLRERDSSDSLLDVNIVRSAWQQEIAAAESFNDPGKFTTFNAYEYTSSGPEHENLHRNVIFRGSKVPEQPFSSLDSRNPEDLWAWMDKQREQGIESLAIPHNSNGSNGMMFDKGKFSGEPFDAAYAEQRMRNEPLVEITQVKGTSDTHPDLSPNDEWGNFEIFAMRIASDLPSKPEGSYVRDAYRNGLLLEEQQGFNPYRFGLIGSSDTHVAAGSFDESNYWGKVGMVDATPQLRGSVPLDQPEPNGAEYDSDPGYFQKWSASGLTGVWAESNTRESIYDALHRKEAFATTGTRIRVRFFAGYDLDAALLESDDFVAAGYRDGVPMGSDLPAVGEGQVASPDFLVWAMQDPQAAPLDRIQVIKGWVADGQTHEQVFDVACAEGELDPASNRCPTNTAEVNLSDCSIDRSRGAAELRAHWIDPAFDRTQRAFYYVRVLENPTCRWSTWDAIHAGVEPREGLQLTIQERAWSSPIWYRP